MSRIGFPEQDERQQGESVSAAQMLANTYNCTYYVFRISAQRPAWCYAPDKGIADQYADLGEAIPVYPNGGNKIEAA